ERCIVATQTNEQAFDLARRLSRGFPSLPSYLYVRQRLPIPNDLTAFPNLQIVTSEQAIPSGPCVVVGHAAQWSWMGAQARLFDSYVVNEASQPAVYRSQQSAGLARRIVLVGDPGQIAPLITCEIERWKSDPAGPQVACPQALLARYPSLRRMSLPVSSRLLPDTVRLVQPPFYPKLPFPALSAPRDRPLLADPVPSTPLDIAIDRIRNGASIVQVELPPLIIGEVDEDLAQTVVTLIQRLIQRR